MSDYPQVPQQISDPISENLAKLSELFPAAVKDGALDLEALRAELGDFAEIRPGDEKYELNWVGKQAAKKEAFKPLLGKTLALKDDGKNTDTTQNLYIEGDNLDALKLLRQNYFGEVKMIYIDPPYNTGNDFVYTDKFKVSAEESEEEEGALSNEGKRLIKNEKSSNRFHARWLDMMYPRLKLAKDLLREDGVIFVSIDDNEVANLRQVCDEVFGRENFVANFHWKKKSTTSNVTGAEVSPQVDYQICYRRSTRAKLLPRIKESSSRKYTEHDKEGKFRTTVIEKKDSGAYKRESMKFKILGHSPRSGKRWQIGEELARDLELKNRFIYDGEKILLKIYEHEDKDTTSANPNVLSDVGSTESAADFLNNELFGIPELFDNPKPVQLIQHFARITGGQKQGLVLDFFSGSSTTAHAVMQLNADDGGKRRFIMVQLPEVCADDSEAAKAGYQTIAEIGKERIRRAGEKIKEELQAKHSAWQEQQSKKNTQLTLEGEGTAESNPYILNPDSLDIGFKSFRIEDTKINWLKKDLRGEQLELDDTTTQDALDFVPGYTDTDVVYELMLRQSNIPLTGTITKPIDAAKRTYLYADAYLVCLEETITQKLVESLAAIEPTPNKYFFRDSAFGTDIALKDETFRRLKAEIHKHHGDLGAAYTVEFI
jgi:adenine-specific DNA-methyltransferase